MVTNWASGTTFCLVVFVSLCLPWFDSVLSFKDVVGSSQKYLNTNECIVTDEKNHLQSAIWYYYADVRLLPETNFMASHCNQALLAVDKDKVVDYPGWRVIWSAKRPVDFRRYVLLERIKK